MIYNMHVLWQLLTNIPFYAYQILFPKNVVLKENTTYRMEARISHPSSWCGEKIHHQVTCSGVKFTFKSIVGKDFPALLFSKLPWIEEITTERNLDLYFLRIEVWTFCILQHTPLLISVGLYQQLNYSLHLVTSLAFVGTVEDLERSVTLQQIIFICWLRDDSAWHSYF